MGLLERFFGPPSKDKFAQLVRQWLSQAGEQGEIRYDRDEFRLLRADDSGYFNLHNVYDEYCAADKQGRERVMTTVVQNWFVVDRELPESFEDLHPDLLPVVRSRAFYELLELRFRIEGAKQGLDLPHQVVADHLAVSLVYDMPSAMTSIRAEDLAKWDVTFFEALEAATRSLEELEFAFARLESGLFISATRDNYDASRLILLDAIRSLEVEGRRIAMVPNRDTLLVTGSDNAEALGQMAAIAGDALKQRPITGIALALDSDEWLPWMPPQGHPYFMAFRNLQLQSVGQDYFEQKELLEKLHAQTEEDIFVASFSAFEKKGTQESLSYCVWPKDVDTLLPQTDLIGLVGSPEDKMLLVPWQQVQDAAGDLMQPHGTFPERWRVKSFPTEQQLDGLRKHSHLD